MTVWQRSPRWVPRSGWSRAVVVGVVVVVGGGSAVLVTAGTQQHRRGPAGALRSPSAHGASGRVRAHGAAPAYPAGVGVSGAVSGAGGTMVVGDALPVVRAPAGTPGARTRVPATGLVVGDGGVWLGSSATHQVQLVRVGPSGDVTERAMLRDGVLGIAAAPSSIWIASQRPRTAAPASPGGSAARGVQLTSYPYRGTGSKTVTAASLDAVDPATVHLAVAGSQLCVAAADSGSSAPGTVVRVAAASGAVTGTTVLPGVPTAVVGTPTELWVTITVSAGVSPAGNALVGIDPATGTIEDQVAVPQAFVPEAAVGGMLWGTDTGSGEVLAVDPTTGAVVDRVLLDVGGHIAFAIGLAADGSTVWVVTSAAATSESSALVRVDAASGAINGSLPITLSGAGTTPNAIAAWSGTIWVEGASQVLTYAAPGQ